MVTFAKALGEWAMPLPGVSKPLALETHEEARAFTGRVVTRVPTRAALGLEPGWRGCQGPILRAVRTHYPHLCSGTMPSPVPRSHPKVHEMDHGSCQQLWFPGLLPWEGSGRKCPEPREIAAGGTKLPESFLLWPLDHLLPRRILRGSLTSGP